MILEVQKADRSEASLQSFLAGTDAQALTAADLLGILGIPMLFNEVTFDRKRGNTAQTLFGSAARTVAIAGSVVPNYNARGIIVMMNVTAASGTGGLTLKIEGVDLTGVMLYTILVAAAPVTAIGLYVYRVYPGLTPVAGLTVNDVLPRMHKVSVAVGDASSYTYSLAANFIL